MLPPQPRQTQTNGVTSAPVRPLLNSCLVVCFNQYIPNSHSLCHKLCCCLLVCITCISVYKVCILDPLCLTSDNSSVPTAQSLYPCICICSSLVLCWLSSPLLSQCICVPFFAFKDLLGSSSAVYVAGNCVLMCVLFAKCIRLWLSNCPSCLHVVNTTMPCFCIQSGVVLILFVCQLPPNI